MAKYDDQKTEAAKTREALTRLRGSEGWDILKTKILSRADALKKEILYTKLGDMNSTLAQEFMKGQNCGLEESLMLLEMMIQEAEELAEALKYEEVEEDADDEEDAAKQRAPK